MTTNAAIDVRTKWNLIEGWDETMVAHKLAFRDSENYHWKELSYTVLPSSLYPQKHDSTVQVAPDNGRYWICKANACDGCVIPWLYLDTLVKGNGRATDQMQLESNGPASLEWLRGELEMYYDPVKESLWICPAESSGGSGYPWIYIAVLVEAEAPGNERGGCRNA